ncbi:MAG TPA: hypothetical protein QGF58_24845 [Myxococcota bacterium]|nr:hypothetical protein [Myxococcota bacterium]
MEIQQKGETCPRCNGPLDPATGTYSGDGLICEECSDNVAIDQADGLEEAAVVEGTFWGGFLAGFFGGCIGAILVLAIAKGAETKKGAKIGFAIQFAVGILLRLALEM